MSIESKIVGLFPIPIGFYKLPREITTDEISFLQNLKKSKNMSNLRSCDSNIFENKTLEDLYVFCNDCLQDYFQTVYRPKNEVNIKITQSWANYTETGQFHHKHIHPNSFISGVFYAQSDGKQDRIYFHDNEYAIHRSFKIPATEYNIYNSSSWYYDSIPGQLILFPSKLSHLVETRPAIQPTRISISFNTFPTGIMGDREDLTELVL
jgi:uncharacterized protein (TIGR02466 family)